MAEHHDLLGSRPHQQGRAVHCSCGEVFVAESGTDALLAWDKHAHPQEYAEGDSR